jgi:hypothetical protein
LRGGTWQGIIVELSEDPFGRFFRPASGARMTWGDRYPTLAPPRKERGTELQVGLQSDSPPGLNGQKPCSKSIHSWESNLPPALITAFNFRIRVQSEFFFLKTVAVVPSNKGNETRGSKKEACEFKYWFTSSALRVREEAP